ncbi:hypothetical protein ANCCAN_24486 [Ancylostoma caninum]|uniref:SCP domain-containing protein n=1 Tax=Ancylostoma caninum TaxID=29170 RepID=A0A368FC54_ANCCA|nr:hypothetical protein ANCCAN_24486 [Ancylostoma caninum]
MNELMYVKPLEDAALNYVKNCDKTAPENDSPVGESFWRGESGSYQLSHVEAMEQAMKKWWGPFEFTGLGNMLEYTTETQSGPLKYFANIVHDKTKQIGCAARTCQKQGVTLVDCRYNTTVAVGDPIYEVGKMPCKCPAVGESFWRGESGSYQLSHVEAMEQAMKKWWGPFESTGLGDMLEYTAETQSGPLKYFANIVHDKTKLIGCAAKTCQKQGVTLVDCRYNTTVAVGDPIYEVGKMPCKCPAGTTCSKLGGLCEATP